MSIVLTSVGFIACSNEEVEATSTDNQVNEAAQKAELKKLQSDIAKLNKEWLEKHPVALTRGEQDYESTDEIAKISITGADLAGAFIGSSFGLHGAIIGGVAASVIASWEKEKYGSCSSIQMDYSDADDLVFNKGVSVETFDSIGYFHNKIIMNIGMENLLNASMDEIDELVLNSTIEVLGVQDEELSIEYVRNNSCIAFFKENIGRLNKAETPEEFCNILTENKDISREEVDVIKTYMEGLSTIDNTNGAYTKEVLRTIDESKLEPSIATELKSGVLVGNASQKLWIVNP